jgi:hypothetical protein
MTPVVTPSSFSLREKVRMRVIEASIDWFIACVKSSSHFAGGSYVS